MVSTFSNFVVWRSYEMFLYIFYSWLYVIVSFLLIFESWTHCFSWCKLQSNVLSFFCIDVTELRSNKTGAGCLIMSVREKQYNILNLVPVIIMYVINTVPIILNYIFSPLRCVSDFLTLCVNPQYILLLGDPWCL